MDFILSFFVTCICSCNPRRACLLKTVQKFQLQQNAATFVIEMAFRKDILTFLLCMLLYHIQNSDDILYSIWPFTCGSNFFFVFLLCQLYMEDALCPDFYKIKIVRAWCSALSRLAAHNLYYYIESILATYFSVWLFKT